MFDIGLPELLLIGIVALIVIGPKDLPGLFRTLGQFTAKARRMARDFQTAMNQAADETGMKDTASDLKNMTSAKNLGLNTLKDAADRFDKWEPGKNGDSKSENNIGENTAALKAEREAEAKALREEAVARANARAEEGFEAPQPEPAAEAPAAEAEPEQASKDAS